MQKLSALKPLIPFYLVVTLILTGVNHAHAAKALPSPPTSYVLDEPGILSPNAKQQLFQTLSLEDQRTTNQVLIAIFQSLDHEDIVDYSNRLYKAWKIGSKGKNNGVLLTIFLNERKMRFEVGYGLEPVMTDANSKRIILENLTPAFREKAYDQGVVSAIQRVISIIDPNVQSGTTPTPRHARSDRQKPSLFVLFFVILLIIQFLRSIKDQTITSKSGIRRNSGGWGGGFSVGGGSDSGWGSGSGDGGGFSGGGGESGGGGASGDW